MPLLTQLRAWLFHLGPDKNLPVILTRRRIFILPTRTGLLFALVLCVMLIGAINYNLSLGHALVFLLTGLGFVAMVHTFRNLIALRLTPGRSDPVFVGQTANFSLHIENPRHHERRSIDVFFGTNDTVRLDLPGYGMATVVIPCAAPKRGILEPGHLTLSTQYPLGLFRAWSYPYPPFSCLVYPEPIETPLPAPSVLSDSGSQFGDIGQEDFTGLRLRQPNDSPRHIAWKAVARDIDNRPLLIKQFAGGASEQLLLDWTMTPAENDVETRLSILTGWVLTAERKNIRYGLNLPGRVIEPSHGTTHCCACLEALALHA